MCSRFTHFKFGMVMNRPGLRHAQNGKGTKLLLRSEPVSKWSQQQQRRRRRRRRHERGNQPAAAAVKGTTVSNCQWRPSLLSHGRNRTRHCVLFSIFSLLFFFFPSLRCRRNVPTPRRRREANALCYRTRAVASRPAALELGACLCSLQVATHIT